MNPPRASVHQPGDENRIEQPGQEGEAEQLAANNVASAQIGTVVKSGAGTITSITLAAFPTSTDIRTPLTLLDAGASGVGPTLFSTDLVGLTYLVEPRPGFALTPGTTPPTWPKTLIANIPFTNGVYVKNCPTNTTFVVNA